MSPLPGKESVKSVVPLVKEEPKPNPVSAVVNVPHAQEPPSTTPVVVMSELDSYITERMKGQPKDLREVEARAEVTDARPQSRLDLPHYFKQFSADHGRPGAAYIFRWINKAKRAVDRAIDEKGWLLVNRTYFPDAPRHFFTSNGGIEVGDAILGFVPVRKAKEMRDAPGRLSRERLKGQMTSVSPDYVMMTGNTKAGNVYQPDLSPEALETSEAKVPGVLTEGRDF